MSTQQQTLRLLHMNRLYSAKLSGFRSWLYDQYNKQLDSNPDKQAPFAYVIHPRSKTFKELKTKPNHDLKNWDHCLDGMTVGDVEFLISQLPRGYERIS